MRLKTNQLSRLRVHFFGIIDLRSHGLFAPKETKNPKMDFLP